MKRILKKGISVFLVVAMLLCAAPLNGFVGLDLPSLFDFKAEAASYSGTCGPYLKWSLDTDTGVLNITGTGGMTSWCPHAPWSSYISNIKTVNIASGVTSIGGYAFYDCSSLTSVTIPDSVTTIVDSAFYGCSSLTSVTIPDGVTRIGDEMFYGCRSLTSISIPDSVRSIGKYAFYGCRSLTSVTIPDGVINIGNRAFHYCSSLTSVTIPDSVTSIGDNAFSGCSSLTSVTIPDGVTSIGEYSFSGCSSLASITVYENNKNYSSDEYGVLFNKNKTTLIQYPIGNTRSDYTIPDSVTSIDYSAFYNCSSLTSVTIPDSVTSIGSSAFSCCSSLTRITVDEDNKNYSSDEYGVLFNKNKTTLIQYPIGNTRSDYTIPDSVTSIGEYAFDGCSSLTSVTIPDSVTGIGERAFYNCSSLESVTIGNSVTSIGSYAFYNCSSLTSVTIPDGVTSIGDYAFRDCSSLASVTIPDSVTSIDYSAFYGCRSLADVYYGSTEDEWNKIKIKSGNEYLTSATMYFNHPDHALGEWETVTEPTCVGEGQKAKKCTICQKILETEALPKLTEHIYNEEITTPATCTTAGVKTFTCSCGDSYTETIKATGHSLKQIKIDATCLEEGKTGYQCQNCFVEYGVTVILAKGHTAGEWETMIEPGCNTEGTNVKKCTACNENLETETIPSKGHSYGEKITQAATCLAEGLAEYTCACGDSYSVKLPVADHDLERYFTAPSSTEPGFDYNICKSCGNMIGDMIFLPPTGFEPTNGMVVDYANNLIYGLDSGVDSLDSYTDFVVEGYKWVYEPGENGFGTGSKAILKNSDVIVSEYTIVIFGDIQGDGWYDGEDAFIVNLIVNGMLDKDDVGEAIWTAADCNHDGVIDEWDVDLLTGAGLLLNRIDQTKPVEELALNSDYIEYSMLIDQSAGMSVEPDVDDSQQGTTDTNTTPEQPTDEINIEAILTNIFEFFKKIFNFIFSFVIK